MSVRIAGLVGYGPMKFGSEIYETEVFSPPVDEFSFKLATFCFKYFARSFKLSLI